MKRSDYRAEEFEKVGICGISCGFNDMRIDRRSVPVGKYMYGTGNDDGALHVEDGDFVWL